MIKKKNNFIKQNFGFCLDLLKQSKLKVILLSSFVLIAILTGIIVATQTYSHYDIGKNYGVVDVTSGGLTTTFFARLLSMLLVASICFGCSFLPWLFPIGVLFLCYRAYLLGLNIALMLILYGLSGIIVTLLIALPCQLMALIILSVFYLLMMQTRKDIKCFGRYRTVGQCQKLIISTLVILLEICILESLLLWLFSAKIILVI